MIRMFIDDERDPPDDGNDWVVVRSCEEFWQWLHDNKRRTYPNHISFDHDLGDIFCTGMDLLKVMIREEIDEDFQFPDNFTWSIHSQNPVGVANIDGLLKSYMKFRKEWLTE